MDKRYYIVARCLSEAATQAIYITQNINYRPDLNNAEVDDLDKIIVQVAHLQCSLRAILDRQLGGV